MSHCSVLGFMSHSSVLCFALDLGATCILLFHIAWRNCCVYSCCLRLPYKKAFLAQAIKGWSLILLHVQECHENLAHGLSKIFSYYPWFIPLNRSINFMVNCEISICNNPSFWWLREHPHLVFLRAFMSSFQWGINIAALILEA